MNFLEVEEWKDRKNIVHGFGTRNSGGDKITRLDWKRQEDRPPGKPLAPHLFAAGSRGWKSSCFRGEKEEAADLWEREGDALITGSPGIAIGVFTADCLPLLLFEPEQRVAAVVHAGWRGTAKEVTRKVVEKMARSLCLRRRKDSGRPGSRHRPVLLRGGRTG